MVKYEPKTYVITAAQGIQNPQSARQYGKDDSKGRPNTSLIRNIENYVEVNHGELQIHSVAGGNCNEVELHPFFHSRNDIYVDKDAKNRNEQNRVKEHAKRGKFYERQDKWVDKQNIAQEKIKEKRGDDDDFKTFEVGASDCPYNMPMHYFWDTIPETNFPLIGDRLNKHIHTLGIPVKPQNQNPLSGKDTFTKDFGGNSVVIASPKRMMRPVPQGESGDYPNLLMTTGACTFPNYNFGDAGFKAKRHHTYGFAAIDILDDKIFLPRIVPAHKNGKFIDLGIKYVHNKKPQRAGVAAMVLGDSHCVEIHPKVDAANMQMMKLLRPEYTHGNDVFAARSISIHEADDPITSSIKIRKGISSLENELYLTGEYITRNANLAKEWDGEFVINWSNHDDMLYRWLATEKYRKDNENRLTAHQILAQDPDRTNAFEKAVKLFHDIPENVTFLKPGEDRKYEGYLCSSHGHQGVNGSRGSLVGLEKSYDKVIIGHVHKLEILRNAISVGTSTYIPLPYQLGNPSTSMAGNAVVYEGGLAQAIPIVKGRWAKDSTLDFLRNN